MDFTFGIIGLMGGVLCAIADILLDLKGRNNKKIGKHKIMDSNWVEMAGWRFPMSITIAAIAVPMYYMGIIAMKNQLQATSSFLANIFWISGTIGAIGGLFIHATLCYFPMIYKRLYKENSIKLAEDMIDEIFRSIKIPFIVLFILLTVVTSVIIIIAIFKNYLMVPIYFIILNPLGLTIIGILLRKIEPRVFSDLPGICMPSLGLGMIGLAALLNTMV